MRFVGAVLLLGLLASGPGSASGASDKLSNGMDKFFKGDLEGAVGDWQRARDARKGDKAIGRLLLYGYKILAKEELDEFGFRVAKRHLRQALRIDPEDPELQKLAGFADKADMLRGEGMSGEIGDLLDTMADQEALIAQVIRLDVTPWPKGPKRVRTPSTRPDKKSSLARARRTLSPSQEYQRGLGLYYQGDYQGASKRFRSALDAVPRSSSTHSALRSAADNWEKKRAERKYQDAISAHYQGDFRGAAKGFRQALRLDPKLKKARVGLAEATRRLDVEGNHSRQKQRRIAK